jgi:enoyl-CoA hydratase/carnithine racemase
MAYDSYKRLRVAVRDGVCRATIDHPPINLLDAELIVDLDAFSREVEADDDVRVVVVDSADDDFFIAHADVALIQRLPAGVLDPAAPLPFFSALVERFRMMPKATIAVIEGRARGGGSEFALSFDMRFAARGRAILGQPEVALGILPGGTGTQRLPRLVGRARAHEIVLGCDDIDADTAERWGYVNRALPPEDLGPFVDRLARRIASFPAHAIAEAKAAMAAAEPDPVPGLQREAHHFSKTLGEPETKRRMERFFELGGQTRERELALGELVEELGS